MLEDHGETCRVSHFKAVKVGSVTSTGLSFLLVSTVALVVLHRDCYKCQPPGPPADEPTLPFTSRETRSGSRCLVWSYANGCGGSHPLMIAPLGGWSQPKWRSHVTEHTVVPTNIVWQRKQSADFLVRWLEVLSPRRVLWVSVTWGCLHFDEGPPRSSGTTSNRITCPATGFSVSHVIIHASPTCSDRGLMA